MNPSFSSDSAHLLREKYNGIETPEYFEDLKRLEEDEPLAFVIGTAPFLGTTVYLDSKPLIPRVETEYWLSQALAENRDSTPLRVLDIFAGSGALGVAWGRHRPADHVTFAELETAHLTTIRKNIEMNNLAHTEVLQSDVWEYIDDTFDIILANPPYIPEGRDLPKSVDLYEPATALYSGSDGLSLIQRFFATLPKHLTQNGKLYMEHDITQKPCELLPDIFTCEQRTDQYGENRYIMAQLTQHGT